MYKSVIFVDFENIQKIDNSLVNTKNKIIVMVGLGQKSFELAKSLFENKVSLELINVNGQGPDALDFFISFYIGKYFNDIKDSKIIIYSNDTGYNPLIKHLNEYGISIERKTFNKIVNETNKKKVTTSDIKLNDEIKTIIEYLQNQTPSQKSKRPKKITTLENDLHTHFSKMISLNKIKEAIKYLQNHNSIIVNNNKISYNNI